MAWSQLYNFGGITLHSVVTDDSDRIYYCYTASPYNAYYYSIAGDNVTQVANSASFDSGALGAAVNQLVYFDGGLYAVIVGGSTYNLSVWKWDGSGTSWTMVYDFGASAGISQASITCSATQIVAVAFDTSDETDYEIAYSADGSSWSSGTRSLSPAPYAGVYGNLVFHVKSSPFSPQGIIGWWDQDDGGILLSATYVLEWGGTGFTTAEYYRYDWNGGSPITSGDQWVRDEYWSTDMLHWRFDSPDWEHSADLSSWVTGLTSGILPCLQTFGMIDYSIGNRIADGYVCGLTTADWTALEEIYAGASTMQAFIRLTGNLYPYAVIKIGATSYLYGKGAAFADPGDFNAAQFYTGTNALVQKSDLPYEGVKIGAMLTRDEDTVYIGMADASNDDPIVTGSSVDDWAAWTAFDGNLATDEPVNAIRKVQ